MQMKSMKAILITQIRSNLLVSSTYFLLGSFSGAGISLIAIIQLIVMYVYDKKETKQHWSIVAMFIAAYIVYSVSNFKNVMDIFPLLATIFFALVVVQKKPSIFRIYGMLNQLCWLVYDIYSLAIINSYISLNRQN